MLMRRKLIERRASELLNDCQIKHPPVNVGMIAKKLDVTVVFNPDASDDISGFLLLDNGQAIIGVNENHSEARQRFTVAHELGHFLLHRPAEGIPHVDRSFHVKFRNSQSSSGQYVEEMEANLFAAELLMPAFAIRNAIIHCKTFDMDNDDQIKAVAETFNVSQQALMIRLSNLGFIKL